MSEAKYTLEENGSISVQNLSAYWLPEMTIKEVIKGSTYTISGNFDEEFGESEEDLHDKSAE